MKPFQLSKFGAHMTILACLAALPVMAFAAKTIVIVDDDGELEGCVKWLYQSPQVVSRVDAMKVCRKGATVKCMELIYQEPKVYSRLRAAELCSEE